MDRHTSAAAETAARNVDLERAIEELRRQIRWLRRAGVSVAALLLAVVVAWRIHDRRRIDAREVVARDFVLTDSTGRARARLSVFPEGSGLDVYAPSGERRIRLLGAGEDATLNLYAPVTAEGEAASVNLFHNNRLMSSLRSGPAVARLEMHTADARGGALLALQNGTSSITLSGPGGEMPVVRLEADATHACTALHSVSGPSGSLCVQAPGLPSLELADVAGNRAVVGVPHGADLNSSGSTAASLILRHNGGTEVRMAPQPHR